MPEQQFRTPPGFYNDYHDEVNIRRQRRYSPNIQYTQNGQTPSTNENSRLFAPTPAITRRQPGGKRKSSRKSSKRRKTSRRKH